MTTDLTRLPPAGVFPDPFGVISEWNNWDRPTADGADLIEDLLLPSMTTRLSFVSSGTEALYRVLTYYHSLGRRLLYVAAYTCPEIVTAAVSANYEVVPLDTLPDSPLLDLENTPQAQNLNCETGVLILSNLFGFPDPIPRSLVEKGLVVIDDACQSALSLRDGVAVGFDRQTSGVWSFGRGKAVCAFGGGAFRILSSEGGLTANDTSTHLPARPERTELAMTVLKAGLYRFLSLPFVYRILSSVPGTGIGETVFRHAVKPGKLSSSQLLAARAKCRELRDQRKLYHLNAELWRNGARDTLLGDIPQIDSGVIPIRLPAICENKLTRERLAQEFGSFGIARSYPQTILKLCRNEPRVIQTTCPNAEKLSETLLTLPTHPGVKAVHVREALTRLRDMEI